LGLPDQEAGKGVPAAHPYGVGVGCCLFDQLDGVVVEPAKAGGPCGPRPAVAFTKRRISLLSSVRRRRRRGFPEGSPSRPPFFCVGRISLLGVFLHRECGIVEGEKEEMEVD